MSLVTDGFRDWENIGSRRKEHEVIKKHLECMQNWRSLEVGLLSHATIYEVSGRLM